MVVYHIIMLILSIIIFYHINIQIIIYFIFNLSLKSKKEVAKVTKMLIKCQNIKYLNLSYNTIKLNEAIIIAKRYNIDLCSYDKIRTISYP